MRERERERERESQLQKSYGIYHLGQSGSMTCISSQYQTELKVKTILWVPVSSTGKVFYSCIRYLGFNPHLHQKLIGVLV